MQYTADGDGHFFAYTRSELASIFNRAGFSSNSTQCYETPWISGHMKFRYLHKIAPYWFLKRVDNITKSLPLGCKLCHQLLVIGKK